MMSLQIENLTIFTQTMVKYKNKTINYGFSVKLFI